jgi:hypothetical protein
MQCLPIIILLALLSCNNREKPAQHAAVTPAETAPADVGSSDGTFSIYIPASAAEKAPALIFFDPEARGKFVTDLYKSSADQTGFIIACSNLSRNGIPVAEQKQLAFDLISALKSNPHVDTSRIYLSGFSGGARVACLSAGPDVKGVIAASAAPQQRLPCRFIGVTGRQDFNFEEVYSFFFSNKMRKDDDVLLIYNGGHQWPPVSMITASMRLFMLDDLRMQTGKNTVQLKTIQAELEQATDTLAQDPFLQSLHYHFLNECFKELLPVDYNSRMRNGMSSPAFRKKRQKLEQAMTEGKELASYYLQSVGKPLQWWRDHLTTLTDDTISDRSSEHYYMIKRLLATLSIQSYGLCLRSRDDPDAGRILYLSSLYHLVDPGNKDAYYFSAVAAARIQRTDEVLNLLEKAVKAGFANKEQLLNEPSFMSLHGNSRFNEILNKITSS